VAARSQRSTFPSLTRRTRWATGAVLLGKVLPRFADFVTQCAFAACWKFISTQLPGLCSILAVHGYVGTADEVSAKGSLDTLLTQPRQRDSRGGLFVKAEHVSYASAGHLPALLRPAGRVDPSGERNWQGRPATQTGACEGSRAAGHQEHGLGLLPSAAPTPAAARNPFVFTAIQLVATSIEWRTRPSWP
jgi:hypothetical protein